MKYILKNNSMCIYVTKIHILYDRPSLELSDKLDKALEFTTKEEAQDILEKSKTTMFHVESIET